MHCTHCRKELTHIESANRWPLLSGAHALWSRSSALTIPNHATRLLGSYASLWNAHQPVRDLLTNLSRHSNTRARVNEGYEVNFYSASELISRCRTVVEKLSQTQSSCDLGSSFVICLKQDRVATYCLSDFLGAAAFSKNSTSVTSMYTNPLYTNPSAGQFVLETNLPHFLPQESSTDTDYIVPMADESSSEDPEYIVAMPAASATISKDWSSYSGQQSAPTLDRNWIVYSKPVEQTAAPKVQPPEQYYSIPMESQTTWGLFEELAKKYEQFIVVFAHQPEAATANLLVRHQRSWRRPVYLALSVMAAMGTIAAAVALTRRGASSASAAATQGLSQTCYPPPFLPQNLLTMYNRIGVDVETREVVATLNNVTNEMVNCAITAPLNVRAPSFTLDWPSASANWQRNVTANLTSIALQLMPDEIPPWYFNLTSLCVWCATDTALLLDAAIAQNQVRVADGSSTKFWSLQLANVLYVNLLSAALTRQGHLPNATSADYGRLLNATLLHFNPAFANSTLVSQQGTRQNLPSFMTNLGLSIYTRIMEKAPLYNASSLFNITTTTTTPTTTTPTTTTPTTTTTTPTTTTPTTTTPTTTTSTTTPTTTTSTTTTTTTKATTKATTTTMPCCQFNVCLPYPSGLQNCRCPQPDTVCYSNPPGPPGVARFQCHRC